MTNYHKLSDRIAAKKYSMVKTLLSQDKSLDLTYGEGTFFNMSIRNNSQEIVKILLFYFKENQLSKYDSNSEEYDDLKNKLKEILITATEDVDISPEMKKVLSPYIDFEDSVDSRLTDFDEFDFDTLIPFENDQNHEISNLGDVIENTNNTEIIS